MSKWYGAIGFANTTGDSTGKWMTNTVEKNYYGDVIQNSRRLEPKNDSTNDDINISNKFSILADPYTIQNFHMMKYLTFMGTRWKITEVQVEYPRLTLSVGGVYNG